MFLVSFKPIFVIKFTKVIEIKPDILKLNGKDPSEVTPYVREYD